MDVANDIICYLIIVYIMVETRQVHLGGHFPCSDSSALVKISIKFIRGFKI